MISWLTVGFISIILGLAGMGLYARSEYRRGKLQAEKEKGADDLDRLTTMARHISRPVVSDPGSLAARWMRRLRRTEKSSSPDTLSGPHDGDGG